MYENGKMRPVEASKNWGRRREVKDGGGEIN
jgi:hypothetical protein